MTGKVFTFAGHFLLHLSFIGQSAQPPQEVVPFFFRFININKTIPAKTTRTVPTVIVAIFSLIH